MNMITTSTSVPTTPKLHTCAICKQTGGSGANWLLLIEGKPGQRVHRPCGNNALKAAPAGVKAELNPAKEQKELWRKEREERNARSFWDEVFSNAKPLKAAPTPVVVPSPAPVQVVQAA